jgi:hypothetical protein
MGAESLSQIRCFADVIDVLSLVQHVDAGHCQKCNGLSKAWNLATSFAIDEFDQFVRPGPRIGFHYWSRLCLQFLFPDFWRFIIQITRAKSHGIDHSLLTCAEDRLLRCIENHVETSSSIEPRSAASFLTGEPSGLWVRRPVTVSKRLVERVWVMTWAVTMVEAETWG